jgi:hypothetical protein
MVLMVARFDIILVVVIGLGIGVRHGVARLALLRMLTLLLSSQLRGFLLMLVFSGPVLI